MGLSDHPAGDRPGPRRNASAGGALARAGDTPAHPSWDPTRSATPVAAPLSAALPLSPWRPGPDGRAYPSPVRRPRWMAASTGGVLAAALVVLGPGCTPASTLRGVAADGGSRPPSGPATSRQAPGGAAAAALSTPGASPIPAAAGQASAPSVVLPGDPGRPASADGLRYPVVPGDPARLASLLAAVEEALRSPSTPPAELPALGHQQQVIYRVLGHRPDLAAQVRRQLPQRWWRTFDLQVAARRAFLSMHAPSRRPRQVPAWRIIQPEPPGNLLRYYREAAAATGIPWQVLAAVNLVESGMGRIDGVSVADAHGPMQFLPSTWAEPGIGQGGNIRDPRTAIHAAARYLVRRGGLRDLRKGLWGYNNSDAYGEGVLLYATLLREDPAAYTGLYHWQIHYAAAGGDLWLPVGTTQSRPLPVAVFLQRSPASAPPPGSSGY